MSHGKSFVFYSRTFLPTCAVPRMVIFCSFLLSRFPGALFRYFLDEFQFIALTAIVQAVKCLGYGLEDQGFYSWQGRETSALQKLVTVSGTHKP